jgi:hypothetical protein
VFAAAAGIMWNMCIAEKHVEKPEGGATLNQMKILKNK